MTVRSSIGRQCTADIPVEITSPFHRALTGSSRGGADLVGRNVEESGSWRVGHGIPVLHASRTGAKGDRFAHLRLIAAHQLAVLGNACDPVADLGNGEHSQEFACSAVEDSGQSALVQVYQDLTHAPADFAIHQN